jgi:hypothetical protein
MSLSFQRVFEYYTRVIKDRLRERKRKKNSISPTPNMMFCDNYLNYNDLFLRSTIKLVEINFLSSFRYECINSYGKNKWKINGMTCTEKEEKEVLCIELNKEKNKFVINFSENFFYCFDDFGEYEDTDIKRFYIDKTFTIKLEGELIKIERYSNISYSKTNIIGNIKLFGFINIISFVLDKINEIRVTKNI